MDRPSPLFVSLLALLLNLSGLTWGLPARWHPDEKADVVLKMARERSLDPESFINPSLPLYAMLPAIGLQHWLSERGLLRGLAADPLLAGRFLSALAGAAAVLWLGLLARRHAPALGVLPALLLAFLPAMVNLCHFATPEAWLVAGTVVTLGMCLDHAAGRVGVLALGLTVGLTASTKYTAAALMAPALAAVWLRPPQPARGPGSGPSKRRDQVVLGGAGVLLLVGGLLLLGPPGAALGAQLHLKDARLLHPASALAFVQAGGRALLAAGVLLVLGALAAKGPAGLRRCARPEAVGLALGAGAGFLLGTPYAALRPLAFLSDLAYNAQTRLEYKGLAGETTSFLAYASLLADALTLPVFSAAVVGLLVTAARAGRSRPSSAVAIIVALALVAPYVLVATGGHRAMRFLAPAWPAAAWLAAASLASLRGLHLRRVVTAAVVARAGVAALLVARLFFVDSRRLASRFLEEHVPEGATIDLIANHAGYAPSAPEGRAIRIVPTLSREMAPVARFTEAAARYPAEASEWLVLTASFYERFLDHPDQQPERAAFFRDLLGGRGGFTVAARFRQTGSWHPPNEFLDPEIVVLRKNPGSFTRPPDPPSE